MKPRSIKYVLWGMWRDLTEEPAWRYEEQPPLRLSELTGLDWFEVGDVELARAHWFWSRRPRFTLQESALLLVMGSCVILSLTIAFAAWPRTSMPKRITELAILLLELAVEIYLIVQRLRFVRWRREYERSIDRLIRTIHPGV